MDRANELYDQLRNKRKRSTMWFVIINISIFVVSALVIILNIFALRKNPANENFTKWLFVVITILVTVSGFVSSILSLYVYRKRNKSLQEKIDKIDYEVDHYKHNSEEYSDASNKDMTLMDNVTKILNQ